MDTEKDDGQSHLEFLLFSVRILERKIPNNGCIIYI